MEAKDYLTIVSVVAGFIVLSTQIRAKRNDDRRASQLDRLNRQLSDLYGPLYALYEAGERNWLLFVAGYSHDTTRLADRGFLPDPAHPFAPPDAGRILEYRRRMEELFMPTNTRMEQAISQHADLLVGNQMPDAFADLLAHVAAARLLMHQWQTDKTFDAADWSGHRIGYTHPYTLKHVIRASFEVLKTTQQQLLAGQVQHVNEAELSRKIDERMHDYAVHWEVNGPWYLDRLSVPPESPAVP